LKNGEGGGGEADTQADRKIETHRHRQVHTGQKRDARQESEERRAGKASYFGSSRNI